MNTSLIKRSNITGSVFKRKKARYYSFIVRIPNPLTGKNEQKWISTKFTRKAEAEAALKEYLHSLEKEDNPSSVGMDFLEFLEYWLEEIKKSTIEQSSYQAYRMIFDRHIKPYFQKYKLRLADVSPMILQKFIIEKRKNGRLDGKGVLSASAVKRQASFFYSALTYAAKMDLLPNNPMQKVSLPKEEKFIGSFYTAEQIQQLLQIVKGTPIELPVYLTSHYGFRRGEVMGLRWQDVDFEQETISINVTRVRIATEDLQKGPKSEASRRSLPLIPKIKEYLLHIREQQEADRKFFGNVYLDTAFICREKNGKPMSLYKVNTWLTKLLKENGMPHIRFHDLRHSTASYLLANNVPMKVIQEWLGHSDIQITMNRYTHLTKSQKDEAADKISKLFSDTGY